MLKLKVSFKQKGLTKTVKVDGLSVKGSTIALFGSRQVNLIMLSDLISVTAEYNIHTPSIETLEEFYKEEAKDEFNVVEMNIGELTGNDRKVLNEGIYPAIKKAKENGLKEIKVKLPYPKSVADFLNNSGYTAVTREDTLLICWN